MNLNVEVCQYYERFLDFSKFKDTDRTKNWTFFIVIVVDKLKSVDWDLGWRFWANSYWDVAFSILRQVKALFDISAVLGYQCKKWIDLYFYWEVFFTQGAVDWSLNAKNWSGRFGMLLVWKPRSAVLHSNFYNIVLSGFARKGKQCSPPQVKRCRLRPWRKN